MSLQRRLKKQNYNYCGTKAADVLQIFLTGKLYHANQLNILVYLQLLRFHNAYHFKVLLHLLRLAAIPMLSFDPISTPHLGG